MRILDGYSVDFAIEWTDLWNIADDDPAHDCIYKTRRRRFARDFHKFNSSRNRSMRRDLRHKMELRHADSQSVTDRIVELFPDNERIDYHIDVDQISENRHRYGIGQRSVPRFELGIREKFSQHIIAVFAASNASDSLEGDISGFDATLEFIHRI
jgi:hypothetical protein